MFKDYEYGWYGHFGSFKGKWMDLGYNQNYKSSSKNEYSTNIRTLNKQIPKLKGVIFIYGDYKDVI